MREPTLDTRYSGFAYSVLAVTTAAAGVALPIDFLTQIDGYLVYLRPWELLPVWGWAWAFYAFIGLIVGVVSWLAAAVIAIPCRQIRVPVTSTITYGVSLSIIALALIRAAKLWFTAHGLSSVAWWMSRNQHGIVVFTLMSCGLFAWRDHSKATLVTKVSIVGAISGLLFAVLSPLTAMFADRQATTRWSPSARMEGRLTSPDIILISVDALAANHMSLYGYSRPTSPNLRKLGQQANVFERYYANANFTTPATNSFINGVLPWTHRGIQGMARVEAGIADGGLVARLKRGGYETLAVSTNPLAAPFHNRNDRWFDSVINGRTHDFGLIMLCALGSRFPHVMPVNNLSMVTTSCSALDHLLVYAGVWSLTDQYDPELVFSAARKLVQERDSNRPMFLWVHLLAPHSPYATSPPFEGMFDATFAHRSRFNSTPPMEFFPSVSNDSLTPFVGRYDESVASADFHIGAFLAWLKGKALYQNAVVAVTADHGESFGHQFGGHGGAVLYEDVIHVPLIIKEPGQIIGRRIATLAEQVDLMPTLLCLAGVPIVDRVEGSPLLPLSNTQREHDAVFSMDFERSPRFGTLSSGTVAIIERKWKYIHYFGYQWKGQLGDALYDLISDPNERINVTNERPSLSAQMRASIEEELRLHGGPVK